MSGYIDISFYCKYNSVLGLSEPRGRPKGGTDLDLIVINSPCVSGSALLLESSTRKDCGMEAAAKRKVHL